MRYAYCTTDCNSTKFLYPVTLPNTIVTSVSNISQLQQKLRNRNIIGNQNTELSLFMGNGPEMRYTVFKFWDVGSLNSKAVANSNEPNGWLLYQLVSMRCQYAQHTLGIRTACGGNVERTQAIRRAHARHSSSFAATLSTAPTVCALHTLSIR